MRKIILFIAILCLSSPATQAYAALEGGTGSTPVAIPAPPNGGQCDFWKVKDSLHGTESGGAPDQQACAAICRNGDGTPCDSQAKGKYQFIPDTWNGFYNSPEVEAVCHQQANGCTAANMANMSTHPQCCAVQECIMDMYLANSLEKARSKECQQLLGKTITGCNKSECLTCQVTESGLLAGMHLGGQNGVCGALAKNSQGASDKLGTSVGYYVCRHKDLPVPGQCTPVPTEVGTSAPILTNDQWQFQIDQGVAPEDIPIGSGTIKGNWVASLMLMAEQFTANMVYQLKAIGMFFDAKEQMEAQRDFQERVAEAHRDYHPSEQMCTFGTFSTNLASTQRRADITRDAISAEGISREVGSGDGKGNSASTDIISRIKQFRDKYCNPMDNGNGLELLCPNETDPDMQNRDIDYTRTIDMPMTLDVNLTDDEITDDEETIFALIDYLFVHDPIPRIPKDPLKQMSYQYHYQNLRSIVAMRGVARNSMANIIALKSASPDQAQKSGPYLKALMKEMGLPEDEIEKILGDNPSYYAQMEFLTKTIYQNPTFYSNLYDKPANVKRIRAAMNAIKLMNDRDIHMALVRREMLLSMMLELRLRERADTVYNSTERALFKEN